MALSQLIYTSIYMAELTPRRAHETYMESVAACKQLGITGRVFADDQQAIAMTEGPTDILNRYYDAVTADPFVGSTVLHFDRHIPAREFSDYSVWLNSKETYDVSPQILRLTHETLALALPPNLSTKVRIMIETFVKPEILKAYAFAKPF